MVDPTFAFFENNFDPDGDGIVLEGLKETIAPGHPDELPGAFARIEQVVDEGSWVALALRYGLGLALEPRLQHRHRHTREPLLHAWVFAHCTPLDRCDTDAWLQARLEALPVDSRAAGLGGLEPALGYEQYAAKTERIRRYIEAGDIYQANLTGC